MCRSGDIYEQIGAQTGQKNCILTFYLDIVLYYFPAGLFKVEAKPNKYTSELGGEVVMKCRFDPVPSDPLTGLKVYWYWTMDNFPSRKVYVMDKGEKNLLLPDVDFQGRVKLHTEELQNGWAVLQVSTGSDTHNCQGR